MVNGAFRAAAGGSPEACPGLRWIEAAIHLCHPEPEERASLYAGFGVEGLLRADSAARTKLYAAFAQNGIMDRDEIREKENLVRRGGGSGARLTVQAHLLPIDDLGIVARLPPERPLGPGAAVARVWAACVRTASIGTPIFRVPFLKDHIIYNRRSVP
ncbi:hypothetical protein [Methylobacterium sp. A52T]